MTFKRAVLLLGVLAVTFVSGIGIYVKRKLDPIFSDPVATLEVTEYKARKITGATTDIDLGYAMVSFPQVSHAEVYMMDDYGSFLIQVGDDQIMFSTPEHVLPDENGNAVPVLKSMEVFLNHKPMPLVNLFKVGPRQYMMNQMMVYTKVVFFEGTTLAYRYEREYHRFLITDSPSNVLSVLILNGEDNIEQSLLLNSEVEDLSDLWIYIDAILGTYQLKSDISYEPDDLVQLVQPLGYPYISETWEDEEGF